MHLESFDYFYKVAQTKSISKVAKSEHISQSALSQQIQKFEENLGHELLKRSNKGVVLTEMGEIVLKYSENILRTYNKMIEDLESAVENLSEVRIEACFSIANYSLPCTLYRIKEKFAYHRYELFSNSSENITENLLNDICDIGFVYTKPEDPTISYELVGTNKIVLVTLTTSNEPDTLTQEDLLTRPLITLTKKYEIEKKLNEDLKKHDLSYSNLNLLFEMDSIEAVKSSVYRNHGIAFLPYLSVKEEVYKKKFRIIETDDISIEQNVYIITKKGEHKNKAVDEFVSTFKLLGAKSFC